MTEIKSGAVAAQLTAFGKRAVACSMYSKGQSFLAAGILLRRQGGYGYVVLHLICQSIELIGKAYLLLRDYDQYQPKLKKYGHDLIKLLDAVENEVGNSLFDGSARQEMQSVNTLYSQHILRYGSGYDLLVDPGSISIDHLLLRLAAILRLTQRAGVFN